MSPDVPLLRQCWFLAGPTASGKTVVGVELAKRLNAEIVALDSMTLYRGMDIGTAKPTLAERQGVPHHLLDLLDPTEDFSVAEYVAAAQQACREIIGRGRVPLFVGGTGLYLRAMLRGVFEGPAADWQIRQRWEAFAREHGAETLHQRLHEVDPVIAARLPPQDQRRIIRALEVHELTGTPLSAQQREQPLAPSERPQHVYWLEPDRACLHARINARVEAMFAAGLVDEVRRLVDQYPVWSRTASQALGYQETRGYLEGQHDLAATIDLIQTRTRQFAKRQHTWFRNLEECSAVSISGAESPEQVVTRILERAKT